MDVSGFISLAQSLSSFGYFLVFLTAILEVFVLVGAFFPGQSLTMASGFLAQQGVFDVTVVVLIVFTGTVIGNFISYYFGKRYGEGFVKKFGKYFYLERDHFNLAKDYVNYNCGKALVIGRFNPILRSFIPFVAGSSNVKLMKFSFYNILGSMMWAIVFVAIGYILGESYTLAFEYLGIVYVLAFAIIAFTFYIFYKKDYKEILKA